MDRLEIVRKYVDNLLNNFDGPYEELLKDADVLQHYLYNTSDRIQENEKLRLTVLLKELGI